MNGGVDVRMGARPRYDSVDANGYELPPLDRQVLPGAEGYGVERGQLGRYHQSRRRVKRREDDASEIWHHL
jgi:hypothetical protein